MALPFGAAAYAAPTAAGVGSMVATQLDTAWVSPPQIPAARNIPKLNGVVGNGLLSRYRVVLDYRRGRCILAPPSGMPDAAHGNSD